MRNEQQQTQGTYAIRVRCGNCNDEQRVDIPRGQAIDETPCPTCGCKRLARAFLTSGWRS